MFRQKQVGNLVLGTVQDVANNQSFLINEIVYVSEKDRWYRIQQVLATVDGEYVLPTGVSGLLAVAPRPATDAMEIRRLGPGFVAVCDLSSLLLRYGA